jgi:hypothetical protein
MIDPDPSPPAPPAPQIGRTGLILALVGPAMFALLMVFKPG